MAVSAGSLPVPLSPLFIFLLLLTLNSGGNVKMGNGQENERKWCVARPSASEAELEADITYACSHVRDSCRLIQEGGACFFPNTLINHASVVMNQYYADMGRNSWNCDFSASALLVLSNPSYGGCSYA
ncbi:glucan endo-1,3-beta-D-glucosidase-like isoform X2 [Neltuma alba]|uniref:glucan endo-1,3-beta-D-glucosidase-like isoform X2 n=1 Tax=Neltuma alba TaxID=207710 RepID=UPI0010A522BF|nr:glucan endo-1,3-beta-D-glucosidase-like isoform X2 [Prosopis alba]